MPYILFCIVASGTPGPNNTLALASGVRLGFRRSLPFLAGVALGIACQMIAVGLGLGVVFNAHETVHDVLRVVGAAYLVWLAYRIATSGPINAGDNDPSTPGFWGAALFQWINPKSWAVTTSAVASTLR